MAINITTATNTIPQTPNTQTQHLREDLATGLDLVMELADAAPEDRIAAAAIVADLYHPHDKRAEEVPSSISPYDALRRVRKEFGEKALGVVARFNIEADTSLAGHSRILARRELASMNMTTRELNTLSTAVENWKQAHSEDKKATRSAAAKKAAATLRADKETSAAEASVDEPGLG